MKKTIKSVLALALVVATLCTLLVLTSCGGVSSTVEKFLRAEEYTIQTDDLIIMVDGASVYYKAGTVEKYLYLVRNKSNNEEGKYYYCVVTNGKITSKLEIDSEEYIFYREELVSYAASTAEKLSLGVRLEKDISTEEGAYAIANIKVEQVNGDIYLTEGNKTTVISGIKNTRVVVPDVILNKKPLNVK